MWLLREIIFKSATHMLFQDFWCLKRDYRVDHLIFKKCGLLMITNWYNRDWLYINIISNATALLHKSLFQYTV